MFPKDMMYFLYLISYATVSYFYGTSKVARAGSARVASLFANFYVCTDSVIAILFQMVQTMCRLCFYICHILWIIFWHTNLGEKRNILCINIYFHIIHALQCSWPCSCYWLPYLCPTVLFAKKKLHCKTHCDTQGFGRWLSSNFHCQTLVIIWAKEPRVIMRSKGGFENVEREVTKNSIHYGKWQY